MESRYSKYDQQYKKLKTAFEDKGFLYIAYDFDDTVSPYNHPDDTCDKVIALLKAWRDHGYFILFTHRDSLDMECVYQYIKDHDIPMNEVNTNIDAFRFVKSDSTKPYWDILLDDKAGLSVTYELLYNLAKEKEFLIN